MFKHLGIVKVTRKSGRNSKRRANRARWLVTFESGFVCWV